MHTSAIKHLSTDAQGKYLLTASDDKNAKLWDASTGELIRTYCIPIDIGNEGKLFACALSPDGATVALGGWTGYDWFQKWSIYIFSAQTGIMIRRISDLPNVIFDLEFSPDGSYLAAALGAGNGIRIYLTGSWNLYRSLTGYDNTSYNICFDRSGWLVTGCFDGNVRLYDASFNLLTRTNQLAGNQPFSLAFSPDGSKLAVSYHDSPMVEVLDGKSLHLLYRPDNTGANSVDEEIGIISFSSDGACLYGGGYYEKYNNGKWWHQIRRWSDAGKGSYIDMDACQQSVTDIKPLPDGDMFFSSGYPDFGRIGANGKKILYKQAETNDYASNDHSHFKTDYSGNIIAFTSFGKEAMCFSVSEKKLNPYTSFEGEKTYKDQSGSLTITDWNNNISPKLNGKNISFLKENEISKSVDISKDRNNIVFGADWAIYCLNSYGEKQWDIPVPDVCWAVNITGNDKTVIAAFGDGTLRWFRMSDGKELLALFAHPDNKRWILWTPSGYYDCSPGAEDMIGWHVNNGADKEANYYPVSKFRNIYYRPDVIDKILETLDEDEALRLANMENNRKSQIVNITQLLPPTISIISPDNGEQASSNSISLRYRVYSPGNKPVLGVKTFIDGRPTEDARGFKPAGEQGTITVIIPSRDCKVSLIAENEHGFSDPAVISLYWKGAVTADILKPKLYLLSIGVSDYDKPGLKLNLAAKDARDFTTSLQKQKGLLYGDVVVRLLTDKDATKDNILDGLDWLKTQTTNKDVAILFLAGHGINDNIGTFYFLPVGADPDKISRTCLMFAEIKNTVTATAGKIIVFADACHSGNIMGGRRAVDVNGLVNELSSAENGAIVFTSSTGKQYSMEDPSWGNGAFTKALVEGINGKADIFKNGSITIKSLDAYTAQRVKELTKGQQSPTTIIPNGMPDFPISVVK